MPDMDTNWEGVRQKLPLFVNQARACGAVSVCPMSQSNILKSVNPSSDGLCFGMSLGYLTDVYTRGKSGADFIANAHTTAAAAAVQRSNNQAVNRFGGWTGRVNNLQTHDRSEYQTKEDLQTVSLTAKDWDLKFDQAIYRFTKVANHIIESGPKSAVVIKTPNHAMAAFVKDGRYGFFDPNFGEVQFNSAENFRKFFVKWFDNDFIIRSYKGVEGGKLNARPARNLVLRLCVFT